MTDFEWQEIRLAVFDVDGTLYDQRCLRPKMLLELLAHCLRRPGDLRVLRLIAEFRRSREELAVAEVEGIGELQYQRPAAKLGLEPTEARRTLESWMLERPLKHLRACRFAAVDSFMQALQKSGIVVAVLSDYPAADKLAALGLDADQQVSAVDPEVDRLKPHPRGLQRVLELTGVPVEQSVMIGDRDERDGECARRAGTHWLIKTSGGQPEGPYFREYADLLSSFEQRAAEEATLQ